MFSGGSEKYLLNNKEYQSSSTVYINRKISEFFHKILFNDAFEVILKNGRYFLEQQMLLIEIELSKLHR